MSNLRVVHMHDLNQIRYSIEELRRARESLKLAGARRAAGAVARALKSVQGAERHAIRCLFAGAPGAISARAL